MFRIVAGMSLVGLLLGAFALRCLIVWGYIDQWGGMYRG